MLHVHFIMFIMATEVAMCYMYIIPLDIFRSCPPFCTSCLLSNLKTEVFYIPVLKQKKIVIRMC